MGYVLKKTVVMVGMMGSGKTAIGSAVARVLAVPFLDSDQEIVKAANLSIAEIFEREGEAFFREKESQVIGRLLAGFPGILSTGGGAFLRPENRDMIRDKGVSVWLHGDLELLWNRVKHKDTRPLLRVPDPKAKLAELLSERRPAYQEAELIAVAEPDFSIDQMAKRVIALLLTRPDVLEAR